VYLIRGDDPSSDMNLVYEGEAQSHCIIEHNREKQKLFIDSARDYHCLLFFDANLSSTNGWWSIFYQKQYKIHYMRGEAL
jgi:hypothetical protein